jgi:hypothetical protein
VALQAQWPDVSIIKVRPSQRYWLDVIDLDELGCECVATDLAVSEADLVDLVAKATGSSSALCSFLASLLRRLVPRSSNEAETLSATRPAWWRGFLAIKTWARQHLGVSHKSKHCIDSPTSERRQLLRIERSVVSEQVATLQHRINELRELVWAEHERIGLVADLHSGESVVPADACAFHVNSERPITMKQVDHCLNIGLSVNRMNLAVRYWCVEVRRANHDHSKPGRCRSAGVKAVLGVSLYLFLLFILKLFERSCTTYTGFVER